MPFPLAAALGLGSAVVGLFSKNKKKEQTYALSPEDLKRRNAWLMQLKAKTQRPNLANQQFAGNMGMLNSIYRRRPSPQMGQGMPQRPPMPPGQGIPGQAPGMGMQPRRPNPYLGMFNA